MSENKNKRNKLAITLLKYLFFFGTLVFIYFKVFRYHSFAEIYHQFSNTLNVSSGLYFTAAFFMMFINWGLEAEKWRLMMHRTYFVSFFTALKATFAGTSFGIFTPNRSGSFLGNMIFVPHPYKAEAAVTVWISSMSQFLATITFGFMGLLAVKYFNLSIPLGEYGPLLETGALLVLMVILSLGYLAYFNTNYFIDLLGKFKWVNRLIDKLEKVSTLSKRALFYYWILSMVRYVVFVVQFFLVFKGFNVHIPLAEFFVIVCLLYAFITFIPSVLGKLGVREAAMLVLLSASGYTDIQILSGSFGLWMLNVILPALLGAVFILKQPLIDKG